MGPVELHRAHAHRSWPAGPYDRPAIDSTREAVLDFAAALASRVRWEFLCWQPAPGQAAAPVLAGRPGRCRCTYRLSSGGRALGTLEISRQGAFHADEIGQLEALLYALVTQLRALSAPAVQPIARARRD